MMFLLGMRYARIWECAIPVLLLVTAIGCEQVVAPEASTMSAVSAISEDVVAGQPIPPPATVIVRDAQGRPVPGVRVTFVDSSRVRLVVTTHGDGKAALLWLTTNRSGIYRLIANAEGLPSVTFTAVVHPGPASQIVSDVDLDQVGEAGQTLPLQPSVRVVDGFGNGIPDVIVTFTAAGPAVSVVEHASTLTDSSGHANAGAWTLGSATGEYTLTAAADQLPTAPVAFRARINAPFVVSSLAAGGTASCAIARSGTYCWGRSFDGGSLVLSPDLISSALPLVSLVVGFGHACGLTSSGTAYCWGENESGQLGLGTVTDAQRVPRAVTGGLSFTSLVAGASFTCGLTSDRQMYCWGDNSLGQLGTEGTESHSAPTAVAMSQAITTMAAGHRHVCATATSGTTYCWGADDTGQLGQRVGETCQIYDDVYYRYGSYVNVPCSTRPLSLPNAPGAFTTLTAGYGTCGLLATGESYCWGFTRSTVPTEGRFVSLAATYQGVCGITATQSISCWSYADSTAPPSKLIVVPGITDPVGLVGGQTHWCAVGAAAMTAFCWGGNDAGQLGNGTRASTTRPLPVAAP